MTDKPKRSPTWSDDDRAMVGREHRARERVNTPAKGVPVDAPAQGVPVDEFNSDADHLTPVQPVIEELHASLCYRVPLGDREAFVMRTMLELLLPALWRHTANVEMRSRRHSDSQETATLSRELDQVQTAIVDIRGENGVNGKLGELTRRMDKAEARKWWAITFLAGLLVTAIGSAIAFGTWMGSVESDIESLKTRAYLRSNRFPPDLPAPKDTQP